MRTRCVKRAICTRQHNLEKLELEISTPNRGSEPIRVIYIMGVGRSGSTVLDTVLGNQADAVSVGELHNLPRLGWVGNNYCACGQRCESCEFWNAVSAKWQANTSVSVDAFIAAQQKFEFFRKLGIGKWGWLRDPAPSAEFVDFQNHTRELFAAIREVSGRSVIVDSSKNPLRAALLAQTPGIELSVVHLVRDGRAVAWSQKKAYKKDEKAGIQVPFYSKPIWRTISYWAAVGSICDRIQADLKERCQLVRYEDFVTQPQQALAQIANLTGLDFDSVSERLALGEALDIGHTVAGNRVRMSGHVKLKADLEWTAKLPKMARQICWSLAGWKLKQYGYEKSIPVAMESLSDPTEPLEHSPQHKQAA